VSGRIYKIERIGFAILRRVWQRDSLAFYRNAPFTFDIHVVEHLVLELAFVYDVRFFYEAVRQGRLTMINMSDDTEVADQFGFVHAVTLLESTVLRNCVCLDNSIQSWSPSKSSPETPELAYSLNRYGPSSVPWLPILCQSINRSLASTKCRWGS
jgi:hypothetical protein